MEVLHDLVGYRDMKIYQNTDWFSFSLDSVLLPNFVTLLPRTKQIIDLGTGNAPIPLILSTRTRAHITGVEIQKDLYDLAKKTVSYNHLENQIDLIHADMLELKSYFSASSIDVITCNPPYFKLHEKSYVNDDPHKTIARHEAKITLPDIIQLSEYLLKNNGVFALVHRTERLSEIIQLLREKHFEVKKMRFIHPKREEESNLILIEARKNGNVGLKVLPPLYVHDEDGNYTEEVKRFFE